MTDYIRSEDLDDLESHLGTPRKRIAKPAVSPLSKPPARSNKKSPQIKMNPPRGASPYFISDHAQEIRDYCRSQKQLWQYIPRLACEAEGRTGYSEGYQFAYTEGIWITDHSDYMIRFRTAIDLWTGEFCTLEHEPSDDHDVLRIANNLEVIDAAATLQELIEAAQEPIASYYNPVKNETERRKRYNQYIAGTKWDITPP